MDRQLAYGRRLLGWEEAHRRLIALGLEPVRSEIVGNTAAFTLKQITALLDRAEQR